MGRCVLCKLAYSSCPGYFRADLSADYRGFDDIIIVTNINREQSINKSINQSN